jgi:hypothetical protein
MKKITALSFGQISPLKKMQVENRQIFLGKKIQVRILCVCVCVQEPCQVRLFYGSFLRLFAPALVACEENT